METQNGELSPLSMKDYKNGKLGTTSPSLKRNFHNDKALEIYSQGPNSLEQLVLGQTIATPLAQFMASDKAPNHALSNRKGGGNHQEKQCEESHARQREEAQELNTMKQKELKDHQNTPFWAWTCQ